ncbi:AAA family ATPase (plasmid) [Leisingera sp. M527]|uniref:ATP-dependent nuclease n=1 Tax=Leisingera sp. M527 TaxID=2867014 RepID=UPI0021A37F00|nr:AAA family ATPase [Leisingera sp. M527]UWQ35357.1 AAA family ATPase [Leisingera sp. M527]
MVEKRSKLVRMFVRNIGCIGPDGVSVALDDVVCVVGRNNSGKSTLLRAYELAQGSEKFDWVRDRCAQAPEDQPSEVILEIHIPEGIGNIGEEWKEERGDLRILTSRWQWRPEQVEDGKVSPLRQTRKPSQAEEENGGYAEDGKAGGADNVFRSRLPQPVRIGSRGDPAEAEKALMKLVLEPVGTALSNAAADADSALSHAMTQLAEGVTGIVQEQESQFCEAVSQIEQGFTGVFPDLSVTLDVKAAPPKFDAAKLIADGSGLRVTDNGAEVQLSQQGAGAQRALFWTMLQVRNRLVSDKKLREDTIKSLKKDLTKAKKDPQKTQEIQAQIESITAGGALPNDTEDPALPGYILLIDEPENALHPLAARAAQRQLYELAGQSEWQVMMTTHSPLFVNPAMDHTTILRLEREGTGDIVGPKTFRTDEAGFTGGEKETLKAIQEMDPTFCEVFFGTYPIVVEGDTEHAAFIAAVVEAGHELIDQVTIIKARGKPQIRAVMKMLIHFRKDFGVLHDCDWPHGTTVNEQGKLKKSPSWAHNTEIRKLVHEARSLEIRVAHEVSIPDFERRIGLPLGTSGKPFEAYLAIKQNEGLKKEVQALLQCLREPACYETGQVQKCDADAFVTSLLEQLRERSAAQNWEDAFRLGD